MTGRYFQRVLLHVLNALTWTISVMHADTKEIGDTQPQQIRGYVDKKKLQANRYNRIE